MAEQRFVEIHLGEEAPLIRLVTPHGKIELVYYANSDVVTMALLPDSQHRLAGVTAVGDGGGSSLMDALFADGLTCVTGDK